MLHYHSTACVEKGSLTFNNSPCKSYFCSGGMLMESWNAFCALIPYHCVTFLLFWVSGKFNSIVKSVYFSAVSYWTYLVINKINDTCTSMTPKGIKQFRTWKNIFCWWPKNCKNIDWFLARPWLLNYITTDRMKQVNYRDYCYIMTYYNWNFIIQTCVLFCANLFFHKSWKQLLTSDLSFEVNPVERFKVRSKINS